MVQSDLGISFYVYDTNYYVRWDLCELWNGARFSTDILTLTPVKLILEAVVSKEVDAEDELEDDAEEEVEVDAAEEENAENVTPNS